MLAAAFAVTTLLYLNRPPTEIAEPVYKPVTVDVAEVVMEQVRIPVQAQGTVTPMQETVLQAEVRGRVVEVSDNFHVGSYVAEGDVILRIDPRDYQTSLLRAQAALESSESNLAQERGRAEVALREWQKLPKGSQRSDEARDLYLRKPQLEQAEAQLLAARADLDTARDNLNRTVIRAPYDALIRSKHSDLGQFVNSGSPLAEVIGINTAEIRLPIPQGKLAYLDLPAVDGTERGALIDLYTDTGGIIKHWSARLHRTEAVFDERSRVLFTVARIDDPYSLQNPEQEPLRVGSFVNATIQGKAFDNIVVLPRYLLRAGNEIWVIDEQKLLRSRRVTVLRTGGDMIFVSEGLQSGELVSLTGLDNSFRGAEVQIRSRTPSNLLHESGQPGEPTVPQEEPEASTAAVEPSNEAAG